MHGKNRTRRSKAQASKTKEPPLSQRIPTVTLLKQGDQATKCQPRGLRTRSLLAIRGSHYDTYDIVGDNTHHYLVLGLPASGDVLVHFTCCLNSATQRCSTLFRKIRQMLTVVSGIGPPESLGENMACCSAEATYTPEISRALKCSRIKWKCTPICLLLVELREFLTGIMLIESQDTTTLLR